MKPAKTPKAIWISTRAKMIGEMICNFRQKKMRKRRLTKALPDFVRDIAASGKRRRPDGRCAGKILARAEEKQGLSLAVDRRKITVREAG